MPGTAVGPDYGLMEDTAQCALEIHARDLQGHAPALGSVCRNPTNPATLSVPGEVKNVTPPSTFLAPQSACRVPGCR